METLHPDLIPYVVNGLVHHRLVIASLTTGASYINQIYRDKLDKVKTAEAEGATGNYTFFFHERPYRFDALLSCN
jgi:hypothetical protein